MMKAMPSENRFLDVIPRIVPAGSTVTICLRARYGHRILREGVLYTGTLLPLHRQTAAPASARSVCSGHTLALTLPFGEEQEYVLELAADDAPEKAPIRVSLYALAPDLFSRRPWRGDVHMHSHHSDGRESPAFVAASCRRTGLDFMALTDHGQYPPSLEAIEAFRDVTVDMLMLPGEEVHPPQNPVHTIHFGGRHSVNDLYRQDPDGYMQAVSAIAGTLDGIDDETTRFQCASTLWAYEQIRKAGGFSIYCHPYWRVREGYSVPESVCRWLFDHGTYDAYELLGGYHRFEEDSNTLQIAKYLSVAASGRLLPIVGVSDAHGCEASDLFGFFQTLVFSPELSFGSVGDSIRQGYSVAVEALPGETVRAFGPYRLVAYALFLLREVLPFHDELCEEESRWMLRHLEGDREAAEMLQRLSGRTAQYYRRIWA